MLYISSTAMAYLKIRSTRVFSLLRIVVNSNYFFLKINQEVGNPSVRCVTLAFIVRKLLRLS